MKTLLTAAAMISTLTLGACEYYEVSLDGLPFNFHVVNEGQLYRSGQPTAEKLHYAIDKLKIKTVINLRGESAGKDWYEDELRVAKKNVIVLIDIGMSALRNHTAKTSSHCSMLSKQLLNPS